MTGSTRDEGGKVPAPPVVLELLLGRVQRHEEAVHAILRPLAEGAQERPWSFARWVGSDGPALRLRLPDADAEALEATAVDRLEQAGGAARGDEDERLLAAPASWRVERDETEVRRLGLDAEGGPGGADVDHRSSRLALAVLEQLQPGRDRFAFALAAMAAVAEATVPEAERPALWRGQAKRWTGAGERGEHLRSALEARAERLQASLAASAIQLRSDSRFAEELDAYVEAAAGEDVAAVTHATNNRLGVSPLEEALLATVVARAAEGAGQGQEPPTGTGAAVDAEAAPALELSHVDRGGEDEAPALADVSLEVRSGEVFGLLGPPGAGKSDLLGIAAGLRVASSGEVEVLGRDPREDRAELERRLGMALPYGELTETATARENLSIRAKVLAVGSVDDILELTGLREQAGTPLDELGRGAQRRVGIAAGLLSEPEVLFLDEPTDALSAVEREALWAILTRRQEAGHTTILATSSLQEARSACDRVALIIGGEIVTVATGDEIAEEHFPERSVRLHVSAEPDRALIEELPDVTSVRIDERPDHWALELGTLQPDELLKLLGADPEFPRVVRVESVDLEGTFLRPEQPPTTTSTTPEETTTS